MKKLLFIFALVTVCLFLICCGEGECKHRSIEKEIIPPTCDEAGYTLNFCTECTFEYKSDTVPSVGHRFTDEVILPECELGGYTAHFCDCGFSFNSDFTPPTGHEYMVTVYEPSCTITGYTNYKCIHCDLSYDSNLSAPFGHRFEKEVFPPTCECEGYTVYTCGCGYNYTSDYVEALGHSFESYVTRPTCTHEGYTVYTCDCGHSYTSDFTPALGHRYAKHIIEPTCTDQGYTVYRCLCGHMYSSDFVSPKGHTYSKEVTPPDCTNEGYTVYTCACGVSYVGEISAPVGHVFEKSIMMPTLSDMGYTVFECTGCGFSYTGDYRFYSSILGSAYADGTEVIARGIDVSLYNYKVNEKGELVQLDWAGIKASGIDYAILKAGSTLRGGGSQGGKEAAFELGYSGATAAGLDVGVYFYTYATTVDQIRSDAHTLVHILEGKQLSYPVYLDLEDDSLRGLSKSLLHEMCVEFFSILQRAGYYTGLYVNDEWLYNVINTDSALSMFEIWYARYPQSVDEYVWNTDEFGQCLGMWQYTDSGYINGEKFDMSYAYKDYPALIKEGGFNGYSSDVHFPAEDHFYVWVITNSLTVRSGEDFKASDNVIGYLSYGDMVEAVEQTDKYTKIIYKGVEAYISAKPEYVSLTPPT